MIKKTIQKLKILRKTEPNQKLTVSPVTTELVARGGGERQASPTLEGIRDDHTGRYRLATEYIENNATVLDMACGVGYGTYIISTETNCNQILAVDISKEAIDYANKFYNSSKITYRQDNCLTTKLDSNSFDVIVSFETIEHINEDRSLISRFFDALKPGGKLLISTPNQLEMPFEPDTFPFHIKHYTPDEFTDLLETGGFSIEKVFSQPDNMSSLIIPGWKGKFNIVVCSKSKQ